ncbi:MAG: hypothetical protein ACYDC6_15655 [Acidobacteriaceae bacterium]
MGSLFGAVSLLAATAPFDLTGPRLEIKITRAGQTLPISEVPNLQPGDVMWLHPDMPDNESVHYLLIPVFLRGSLNPPPSKWFTKVEVWRPQVRKNGVTIQVPPGALEALLFWAPDTGGGFTTVRSAVRARPGVFVRAAQDLYAADLTRSRMDAYIAAVKNIAATDPADLQKRAKPLSRTLYLKIDAACFDLPTDQQESCLIENPNQVVLNDAQSQSMVTALTSGAASDMINQLSFSTAAGGGMYSPYVGAVVDMVRIMGSLHTAQYAYIPAIAVMRGNALDMKLSNPPSFSNPKSVMVSSLLPVSEVQYPALRAVHPQEMLCLQRPSLVLTVEGAPLVFSTGFAHQMFLRVQDASGHSLDLPATPDAERGGFVVDAMPLKTETLTGAVTGELRGSWGFDPYNGPVFAFTSSHPETWTFPAGETGAVTAAPGATLRLQSNSVTCVEGVNMTDAAGSTEKASWKPTPPKLMEVNLPLHNSSQGVFTVAVAQYGQPKPDAVQVHVYPPTAVVSGVDFHAGDMEAEATGNRLDEVQKVEIGGLTFQPQELQHEGTEEKLRLKATGKAPARIVLQAGTTQTAHVHLKDGRVLDVSVTVAAARPRVQLLSKNIALNRESGNAAASLIRLGNDNDLPQSGSLTFFLKSLAPKMFSRDEKIEVAAVDGGFETTLGFSDGSLTLQDAQTLLAVLNPGKSFGPSAFGQLQFRPVTASGVRGDWQALVNLVRLPKLKEVRCPASPDQACTLLGENLFLIDSVADNKDFKNPVSVPPGFSGSAMKIPRPNGGSYYLKLRDDPSTVNLVASPIYPAAESN